MPRQTSRRARLAACAKPPRLSVAKHSRRCRAKSPKATACRIVSALDRSVFAIQGPPGAGKTFTGARMICQLVKQGKKVGVTALSHKVIRKLLEEVLKRAVEEGVTQVRCMQKLSEGDDLEMIPRKSPSSTTTMLRSLRSTARNRQCCRRNIVDVATAKNIFESVDCALHRRSWTNGARRRRRRGAGRTQSHPHRRSAATRTSAQRQPSGRRRKIRARTPDRRAQDNSGGQRHAAA